MGPEPERGSTAAQAVRAEALAEESRRRARRAAERAAQAGRASADVHESAALLHDRLADSGMGDQHRQQARRHRRQAQADRIDAQEDERLRDQLDSDD